MESHCRSVRSLAKNVFGSTFVGTYETRVDAFRENLPSAAKKGFAPSLAPFTPASFPRGARSANGAHRDVGARAAAAARAPPPPPSRNWASARSGAPRETPDEEPPLPPSLASSRKGWSSSPDSRSRSRPTTEEPGPGVGVTGTKTSSSRSGASNRASPYVATRRAQTASRSTPASPSSLHQCGARNVFFAFDSRLSRRRVSMVACRNFENLRTSTHGTEPSTCSTHSGGVSSRVLISSTANGNATVSAEPGAENKLSRRVPRASAKARSTSSETRTALSSLRWNATRRYSVRTDGATRLSPSSNRAISSASRRRAARAASPPLSNSKAPSTFDSVPFKYARASRRRSANRSFVEPSRLQLSWCVLRSTKTGDEPAETADRSSSDVRASRSPYHRARTRVAPCSRVSLESYTAASAESRYTEVTAPPSRAAACFSFEPFSSFFSSAGKTSTGRCFASSSFSASACLGSTQYFAVLRSNASGGRHVPPGVSPAAGSRRARVSAYAALAAKTTGSNAARTFRKAREKLTPRTSAG